MQGIVNTSTDTLRRILGNGVTYEVPKFQRDYSWDNEQWDDLWQDIEALLDGDEDDHYMGYLVLQTSNNKNHKIIDGQQRITTLSLLIIAVLMNLKRLEDTGDYSDDNRIRREELHKSYIGALDPTTLVTKNKLKLNRNNDRFFKTYVASMQNMPSRGINSSEKLIKKCAEWFDKKLSGESYSGEKLSAFVDTIVDKLFFTVITVGDELNAYKVFETLNARGVQLSSADLLKNYFFSVVDSKDTHNSEFDSMEDLWGNIIGKLGSDKLPEFLRYYWNSTHNTTRKSLLFKTIRKEIKTKKEVFSILRDLENKADVYVALRNPDDELWGGDRKIREHLMELKIFGAKQPTSLLLSAYDNLDISQFKTILRFCSVIYFRYNIIGGLNPNEEERVFNSIAQKVANDKNFCRTDFSKIYIEDDTFENDFTRAEFSNTTRNRKIIKYILTKFESDVSGVSHDVFSDKNSIEHILPENPDDSWDISDAEVESATFRIGNLTLLEKNDNNDLGNESYLCKREVYSASTFGITRKIAETYHIWGMEQIVSRQTSLAAKAKSIWSFDI
ncbi:MAG: DUF262 domain-containing HNH endonuclease family protein [Kiritimatiellae bacterium]|jgi:hypothetical protein|nr:DUF262 domain-containing HNH endonuclease family protein [Kiritimatiellia bacterium]